MQRIKTYNGRYRKVFVCIKRPRRLQLFTKPFFELLESLRNQVVHTVDSELKTEVIKDCDQEFTSFQIVKVVYNLKVLPRNCPRLLSCLGPDSRFPIKRIVPG